MAAVPVADSLSEFKTAWGGDLSNWSFPCEIHFVIGTTAVTVAARTSSQEAFLGKSVGLSETQVYLRAREFSLILV